MSRAVIVIYNLKSGTHNLTLLKQAFHDYPQVAFYKLSSRLPRLIKQAQHDGITTVVAAGGDGTVNAIAQQLIGTKLTLGIVPMGTFNHFAKDINIPMQVAAAVEVIFSGRTKLVDTAAVNGQLFINNSSIGIYPAIVKEREKKSPTIGKWLALLVALSMVLPRTRRRHLQITIDDKPPQNIRTPFIFIGNNSYQIGKLGLNNRTQLDKGELSLYWITTKHVWGTLAISIRAALGKAHKTNEFTAYKATKVIIASKHQQLLVARDGEVTSLRTPLNYKIKPRSLQVKVPKTL